MGGVNRRELLSWLSASSVALAAGSKVAMPEGAAAAQYLPPDGVLVISGVSDPEVAHEIAQALSSEGLHGVILCGDVRVEVVKRSAEEAL